MKRIVEESEFIPCDILDIIRYLRRRNPAASNRFIESFKSSVEFLAQNPHVGRRRADLGEQDIRTWRVSGFRNHLIFYELFEDRLRLPRVLHGYRDLQSEISDV